MSAAEHHIRLARLLPRRLQRFFAFNPPQMLKTNLDQDSKNSSSAPLDAPSADSTKLNPFVPHKHPATGRWHPPIYSLRRQAELVKLAKINGIEELLPYGPKSTAEKQRRREEHGLRIQGMGIGKRVKGHKWERGLKDKLEKRRQAMLEMPKMIQEWKQVSSMATLRNKIILILFKAWARPRVDEMAKVIGTRVSWFLASCSTMLLNIISLV